MGHKWNGIDRAFHRAQDSPPVELYKLEEAYFVVDGHHRVSVARYHHVQTAGAAVVEFHPQLFAAPVPATSKSEETGIRAVCTPLPHYGDTRQRGQGGKRACCLDCGVTMEELDPKIPTLLRI